MNRLATLATAALVLGGGALQAQQVDDSFKWTGRLAAGKTLEVRGVNGNVTVKAAAGDEARVAARKSTRRGDLATVEIKVEEHAGGVTICAVYLASRGSDCTAGNGPRPKRGRDEDEWNERNNVAVNFTVEVPAGVRFEGGTVNGEVEVAALRSDVEVSTVNGDIALETTGTASARTVNGGVKVRMGKATWDGTLDASTVNGGVEVTMPTPTDLEVDASTLNGSIASDFPLTLQGRMSPRRLRGTIGKGGSRLRLETVNGDVELRKAS